MTKPPTPPRGRSSLGSLVRDTAPVIPEGAAPAVCGKPTMAQDAAGDWLPCTKDPGHDGGCG